MSVSDTQTSEMQSKSSKPVSEFDDGRKVPPYAWKKLFLDWWNHRWSSNFSDSTVETRLLSFLPFFPKLDGVRTAKLIDTNVGDGNYIHEFYIENTANTDADSLQTDSTIASNKVKDMVLIHGYAASLGLFLDNFDRLSLIPGVRVHAIDMLGFGFSSRPNYPKYKCDTIDDVRQNEDWFLDSIENWRKRRGIENFVLIGHSFGGYLSCAYAMKYNQRRIAEGKQILIDKLVLLSPVGVERHANSLLKNADESVNQVSPLERLAENTREPEVPLSREITSNQEDIVKGTDLQDREPNEAEKQKDPKVKKPESTLIKIVPWLWERHASPFALVRKVGPIRSKMISLWTTHRFSHIFYTDPQKFQSIHDYFYRVFNGAGSGEYAITRILAYGALARLPLLDRCPLKFVEMNLPTLWLYGDKDWMNRDAGKEMVKEINGLCKSEGSPELAKFGVISNAGHHLYLDNPDEFADTVLGFLNA